MPDEIETTETTVNDPIWIYDLDRTKETIFYTTNGDIHVKHEITLGDVAVITLLTTLIIVFILDRVIRR